MQTSTFLWIGGLAAVAIWGIYTIKSSKSQPSKIPHRPVPNTHSKDCVPKTAKPINQMAAKSAFLKHVNQFAPRLNSLCDGTYKGSDWVDEIIEINDQDLIELWKKIHNESKAILRVLSGWGLKPEMCMSFVCMETHKNLYATANGLPMEIGKTYNVTKQCWILTTANAEGKNIKSVLVKGEVI